MRVVRFFIFVGLLISALNIYAFNSGYPKPQTYQFESNFPQRAAFDAYFYKVQHSKGTIVYIYGGGCLFPGTENMLDLSDFGKKIIAKGYSLYIPHYRQSLEWDMAHTQSDIIESDCKKATLYEIADIKSSIHFLSQQLGEKNIFVWGHSFGAFLVNVMSLEKPENSAVKGYISSNGWWNVTKDIWGLWMLSPVSMSPSLQDPGNLSRILIVHTEDDDRIPINQINYFKYWISQSRNKPNYKLVVYSTGGHSYIKGGNYPSIDFLNEIFKFVK